MKWAFKQLGVRESDLPFAKVAVYNPDTGRPAVLALRALPFGATGSVHGFCRCSLALWHIAVSLLMLPLTVFFDDYTADTAITLEQDCHSLTQSFLLLLKLLGWQAALTGSKATDFAESFVSLGIAYILPRTPDGFVRVHNTDSRKREVATTCLRILQSGALSPAEALAFAGRLRWLDAQTFGRIGRWAFRVILEHGTKPGRRSQRQLTRLLTQSTGSWIMSHKPPRELSRSLQPRRFRCSQTGPLNKGLADWEESCATSQGAFQTGFRLSCRMMLSVTGIFRVHSTPYCSVSYLQSVSPLLSGGTGFQTCQSPGGLTTTLPGTVSSVPGDSQTPTAA